MSIAAQSPLNLEDIKFDQPGGPVRFDNPSDTIFASLFLPASISKDGLDSVPWEFCDRILSAIRSPQFNPKEVTFKNCGDMFRRVGNHRRDLWSAVEARSTCNASFPLPILDGIVDCLKAAMPSHTSSETGDYGYDQRIDGREWTKTLQSMMLVHSSWHARAKRCLGYSLVSTYGPTPLMLQNPTFGEWTKELHLSYNGDGGGSLVDLWSIAPTEPNDYFLDVLCARVHNVRFVNISLEFISPEDLAPIFKALSYLDSLEKLLVKAADDCDEFPVHTVLTAVSEARHPTLRVLKFQAPMIDLANFTTAMDSLASFETLHSIELVSLPLRINQVIGMSRLLWTRNLSKGGSHFDVQEIRIDCVSESDYNAISIPRAQSLTEGVTKLLQDTKRVKFRFVPRKPRASDREPESRAASYRVIDGVLGTWLALCTSAHTVDFQGFLWTQAEMFQRIDKQFGALAKIRELVIEAASAPCPPPSNPGDTTDSVAEEFARAQFQTNDAELSEVVGAGLFPGLLSLKVIFPERWLGICVPRFASKDAHERGSWGAEERRMLLPHCRQRCSEKCISFHVEIV
ncbi:hypothetical protein SCHPADRAFT_900255 [Schizopora paradoxa]|uniref:Uncharacterized protein n=1 Tax=Schizopora paradoxa TaxID=27342 RepID=A0A0H2SLB1_9AGAM|nr:hypothetical protein SCHPADRAFT_900255 [Schizopora paradoxa]